MAHLVINTQRDADFLSVFDVLYLDRIYPGVREQGINEVTVVRPAGAGCKEYRVDCRSIRVAAKNKSDAQGVAMAALGVSELMIESVDELPRKHGVWVQED